MKIELTDQEINIIFQALGELPLKLAGPVFSSIQQQIAHPEIENDRQAKDILVSS